MASLTSTERELFHQFSVSVVELCQELEKYLYVPFEHWRTVPDSRASASVLQQQSRESH